jgi:cholesterol transport system auxiliary component
MKPMHRILPACALAAVATGCGTGVGAPQHYYVLDPVPASSAAPGLVATAAQAPTLLVTPTTAAGFYDAQAIVYSQAIGTRAYYQLNSWTEPPGRRLVALLTERLRRSGAFGTVTTATGGARGTLVLDTQLDEIYHDAATSPGSAKISLTATLSDPARRFVAGQRRFTASAPAPTPDAAGAVQAFDVALGPLLDEVVAWAGQTAAQSRSTLP